jgi:cobalt-zinc-cadmium efflux system protein
MSHSHSTKNYNKAFAIGISLNIIFVVIEAIYGVLASSLALLADAGHNLSDVLGLLLAWGAFYFSAKPATEKRTYGFRKITVIASVASAIILLLALGGIVWEAISRFNNPQPIAGMTVIIVALIGVVINTITALLFISDQKHDLNIRGAFLHMAADAGISLGVALAGFIYLQTQWQAIDPIISIVIVVVVLIGTWALLRDSFNLSIDAVPENIDVQGIKQYFQENELIHSFHDLHIWAISTTVTAMTVHLVVKTDKLNNQFLMSIQKNLHDKFSIEHTTIQLEHEGDTFTAYDPDCH